MEKLPLQEIGKDGESAAASFIREKGFIILATNYRSGRSGEIDIIAQKNGLIVFFEVKSRRSDAHGGTHYAIGGKKMRAMTRTARCYLAENRFDADAVFRFDCILLDRGTVVWVEDICRKSGF